MYVNLVTMKGEKTWTIVVVREKIFELWCVLKNRDGRVLTQDEEILNRWAEYFSKPLSETWKQNIIKKNIGRIERLEFLSSN